MPTLEQTIDALDCFATKQHKCGECPYNPKPGMRWVYGCVSGQIALARDAQKALKDAREGQETWTTPLNKSG